MNKSLIFSLSLHILIYSLFFIKISLLPDKVTTDNAVVLDVIDVAEITNVKIEEVAKKPVKEEKPPVIKEEPKKVEDKVEKPKEESKIKDTKEKIELQEKKGLIEEETIKKKVEEKKVEEKKAIKEDDLFNKMVLKSLEIDKKPKREEKKDDIGDIIEGLKGETNTRYNSSLPLSISENDAIRSQIKDKWNMTAFSGGQSLDLKVKIEFHLDKDANVIKVFVKQRFASTSPQYQAFVESAVRAVKKASPLKNLSSDKFKTWEIVILTFDPKGTIY